MTNLNHIKKSYLRPSCCQKPLFSSILDKSIESLAHMIKMMFSLMDVLHSYEKNKTSGYLIWIPNHSFRLKYMSKGKLCILGSCC